MSDKLVLNAFDRREVGLVCEEETLTEQHHKKSCDINNIMAKYQKTRMLDHVNTYQGDYSDVLEIGDYHDCQNKLLAADEAFNSLPSEVRGRFGNDPGAFLEFVSDGENRDEMVSMGLIQEVGDPNPGGADATDPSPSSGVGDGGTGTGSTPSGEAAENAGDQPA